MSDDTAQETEFEPVHLDDKKLQRFLEEPTPLTPRRLTALQRSLKDEMEVASRSDLYTAEEREDAAHTVKYLLDSLTPLDLARKEIAQYRSFVDALGVSNPSFDRSYEARLARDQRLLTEMRTGDHGPEVAVSGRGILEDSLKYILDAETTADDLETGIVVFFDGQEAYEQRIGEGDSDTRAFLGVPRGSRIRLNLTDQGLELDIRGSKALSDELGAAELRRLEQTATLRYNRDTDTKIALTDLYTGLRKALQLDE